MKKSTFDTRVDFLEKKAVVLAKIASIVTQKEVDTFYGLMSKITQNNQDKESKNLLDIMVKKPHFIEFMKYKKIMDKIDNILFDLDQRLVQNYIDSGLPEMGLVQIEEDIVDYYQDRNSESEDYEMPVYTGSMTQEQIKAQNEAPVRFEKLKWDIKKVVSEDPDRIEYINIAQKLQNDPENSFLKKQIRNVLEKERMAPFKAMLEEATQLEKILEEMVKIDKKSHKNTLIII